MNFGEIDRCVKTAAAIVLAAGTLGGCGNEKNQPERFITSVSTMNQSKDRLRNPLSTAEKKAIIQRAKALGVTHIGNETPYDGPPGTDTDHEAREWISLIHSEGLGVFHRHTFLDFEGIYQENKPANERKNPGEDFIGKMRTWMLKHADLISSKDIWMPIPEPFNAGVRNSNCPSSNDPICIFQSNSRYNAWLQKAVEVSKQTLQEIGKPGVLIACCGFNGFELWGNNPVHPGKSVIDGDTIRKIDENGIVAIDHYPDDSRQQSYEEAIDDFKSVWPDRDFLFSEFGPVDESQNKLLPGTFRIFARESDRHLRGAQYWQLGPAEGPESLLNPDLKPNALYKIVRQGFSLL